MACQIGRIISCESSVVYQIQEVSCREVGGAGLAGGLPGLGSSMIRGPYAGWQLGQGFGPARNVYEWPPGLARRGTWTGEVAKAVEPTDPSHDLPLL